MLQAKHDLNIIHSVHFLECNDTLSTVSNYYHHVKLNHGENSKLKEKKVHQCIVCSKTFEKKSKLFRHQEIHDKRQFTCDNCNKAYSREDWYKKHLQSCGEFPLLPTFANEVFNEQQGSFND